MICKLFLLIRLSSLMYTICLQNFTHFRCCPSENLEPHSAPLEIGHPEVGRYFSEFADTHYAANEELQARYPEDMDETLGTVLELYHRHTAGSGSQNQAPATDQNKPPSHAHVAK